MKEHESKYILSLKDILLIILFIILATVNIISNIKLYGYGGTGELIEQTIMILIAYVGLAEIAYYCHWYILVPDFFIYNQQKERKDEIANCMKEYYKNDTKFVNDYSEERIKFILSQMGITTSQLDKIRLDLIKMRCMPLKSIDDAKKKIEYYVKSDYPMVISQSDVDSAKLSYHEVDYYINFTDPMFLPEYSREIASLLSFLIKEKSDLNKVDRLIIPYDSNFLLGVEVGKRLSKPVVKMRMEKGKVITEQPWEGQLNSSDKVIIVHDVLVKGEQIIDTLDRLPKTCEVLGVYCLIARKEWDGMAKLKQRDVLVEPIVCLDDNDICTIRGK